MALSMFGCFGDPGTHHPRRAAMLSVAVLVLVVYL